MIIKYSDYETYICKDIDKIPLHESKGIPDVVKIFTNIIYNKLNKKEKNYYINIDKPDFYVKLNINLQTGKNFYGSSFFNDVENSKCAINIEYPSWNENELKRLITHELLHIYELYNRIKNNVEYRLQWDLIQIINSIKTEDDLINDLKTIIYWTSDQEINSSIAELYPILYSKNSTNKELLEKELETTRIYKILRQIENFNWKEYNIDYDELKLFFNKISNIKSKQKFNLFKKPQNEKEIITLLNKWQKLFKLKSIHIKKKSIKIIEEIIKDIKNDKFNKF